MAGVFVRPALVIEPGLDQFGAAALILIATIGITFSLQARFATSSSVDVPVRLTLAALSLVVLLHPDDAIAAAAGVPVLLAIGYWLLRCRALGGTTAPLPDAQPASIAAVSPQLVDTERGRMS
jgi:hypothetical protein